MDFNDEMFAVLPSMWSMSSAAGCPAYPQSMHPFSSLKFEIHAFTRRARAFSTALTRSRYPSCVNLRLRQARCCSAVGLGRAVRARSRHTAEQYFAVVRFARNDPPHFSQTRSMTGVFSQEGIHQ